MKAKEELIQILANMTDEREMKQLLTELLSPREFQDLTMRWQLIRELAKGEPQRAIAARNKISLCKITRGSKILKAKQSITRKLVKQLEEGEKR